MKLIDQHRDEILDACRESKVKELHVFGSVLTDEFSKESDVDFAVDFGRTDFNGSFAQFIKFKDRLEAILDHEIDLVSLNAVRNPVFAQNLDRTKECVYAA